MPPPPRPILVFSCSPEKVNTALILKEKKTVGVFGAMDGDGMGHPASMVSTKRRTIDWLEGSVTTWSTVACSAAVYVGFVLLTVSPFVLPYCPGRSICWSFGAERATPPKTYSYVLPFLVFVARAPLHFSRPSPIPSGRRHDTSATSATSIPCTSPTTSSPA